MPPVLLVRERSGPHSECVLPQHPDLTPTSGALDREALRATLRTWSDLERRIALERVVEQLSDSSLETLLDGLVYMNQHCAAGDSPTPTLRERVEAHVAATRRGDFLGQFEYRNHHGERAPQQTLAWLAATAHLFDLSLERARHSPDEDTLADLRSLTTLVQEVDQRAEEFVVFEDANARDLLGHDLDRAMRYLRPA